MKYLFVKFQSRILPRAVLFLLCLTLSAGCSPAPSVSSGDVFVSDGTDELTDGDGVTTSDAVSGTIPPDQALEVTEQPMVSSRSESGFAILFVNVGKADAAILRFGSTAVLIDTGTAESAPQLIAGLNALGVTQISAVFITHSHSDHLGGLDALSANYDIPMIYSPYYSETDKNGVGKIIKRAEKLNLPHTELKAGDTVPVADGVVFTVLGPLSLNEQDDNDNSLVLQFSYGGKTFLFTGDMQFAEEDDIIASSVNLKSDVLKVGNHGNPDATGRRFGALVSPSFAVISTDTSVDTDSANPIVSAMLPIAQIMVTQDFPIGILLTLDSSGSITFQNPARAASTASVAIDSIDVKSQTITLVNTGTSMADLSGMILFSFRSDATLRFPEGTMLDAGDSLMIGNGGEFIFAGEDKPLDKKKDNSVFLYDRLGSLISKLEE